jgi:DNA-binding MarR family transcriptional regulator
MMSPLCEPRAANTCTTAKLGKKLFERLEQRATALDAGSRTDLATFTGLERSTISGLIDRAAQRGLVTRIADPHDGRSVRVSLTESARGLVPAMTAGIGDRITPLTARLSTGEQKRLTALLTKALGRANP